MYHCAVDHCSYRRFIVLSLYRVPSHTVRLAFAISEWLCSLLSQLFPFNVLTFFVLKAQ